VNPRATSHAERNLWIERLKICGDEWCRILEVAESVEEAREHLLAGIDEWEAVLRGGSVNCSRIDLALALEATRAFRDMLSPESEAIAGFSTIELLWELIHGLDIEPHVTDGFAAEFEHLFLAMSGKTGIGRGWIGRRFESLGPGEDELPKSGRRAGISRSRFLDRLAEVVDAGVSRHPSGLSPSLIEERARNRQRILKALGGSVDDWNDARWQMDHVLRGMEGVRTLESLVPLTRDDLGAILTAVRGSIPWGITPYYLSLFDFSSAARERDGQVRTQVIPSLSTALALAAHHGERRREMDFMRERDTSPIDHVTRRYPGIAIFKITETCPQICTYCQRNWEITDAMGCTRPPSIDELEPVFEWFSAHKSVREVLITGGDPLILSDETLAAVLDRLARMDHVRSLRIGTRFVVTVPMRITAELGRLLGSYSRPGRRNLSLVTHVESAAEVTPDVASAVAHLRSGGVSVYNQQVFSLQTSRRFQTAALRIALREVGIDPYYTFYMKGKPEHADQLVPVARLLQERKEEARLLPGLYRTDEPVFNVPGLGKNHLRARQDREWIGVTADGRRVYLFHPWEKAVAPAAPWPYVDVSITGYLRRLRLLGEDPAEYESIWYYH